MATYLKRTSKLFDLSLMRTSAEVNLRDLMCPVCRGILIEPVTLPCTHNLCLRCLKGTFEHNSLSCPLCRVRVGSWLRTATKSETLVNTGLWELIRSKFPKEVEDKFNGDDGDIELNAGYTTTNKILSAAGEIRREYEAQLQMAEQEIRLQREAAEIASQALIKQIQEEEQQKIAQLAKDQFLAKSLAKKEISEKQKNSTKYYNECLNMSVSNCSVKAQNTSDKIKHSENVETLRLEGPSLESGKINLSDIKDGSELRRSNIALISKIRAERYASNMKTNVPSTIKDSSKFYCPKSVTAYNTITKTIKDPVLSQPSTSSYTTDGCSTSKIYGTQSKEELRVPSDVLNCKGKSLGVEVCVNIVEDDERTGSAESAGSHDSINQEIHHFKPIKAMPRTPLKLSSDGKQIDPKIIRVVPIIKRVSNIVPKPPSPTHIKRIIGCSWSAFKGKARQDLKAMKSSQCDEKKEDYKSSPSVVQPNITFNKSSKSLIEATQRIDYVPEVSFDNNKNYAKNINRTINGTKINKKLILDDQIDTGKIHKQIKNGMIAKHKRPKNLWVNKKDIECTMNIKETIENDSRSSASSASLKPTSPYEKNLEEFEDAVENIAERIKKRKINSDRKNLRRLHNIKMDTEIEVARRSTKRLVISEEKNVKSKEDEVCKPIVMKKEAKKKICEKTTLKRKSRTGKRIQRNLEVNNESRLENNKSTNTKLRKSTRNTKLKCSISKSLKSDEDSKYSSDSCHESLEDHVIGVNDNKVHLSDEEVIEEQKRIEKLVLQEKEDFELAQRLQAKFDELERVAGRTRRSRRAIESGTIEFDLFKYVVGKDSNKVTGAHTAKSAINQTMSSETKRGRPQKRMLK